MTIERLKADDDAVSPVIGVILMVAITVILAAVIATFVLGLGEQISETSPNANFEFDYDSGGSSLEVTHNGGQTVEAGNLYVRGSGDFTTGSWSDEYGYGASSDVRTGNSITISNVDPEDTVRIVWQNDDGSQSATLQVWEGPDA